VVEETRARSGATTLGDWHDFLIGGLVTLIMAIVLLVWPHATVKVLLLLLGILAIVSGLAALVVGLTGKGDDKKRTWTIARGVISLILGIVVLARPGFALSVALILIGVWALVIGVLDINRGMRMRESGRGAIMVSGAVWSLLGVLLLISAAVQKATWFIVLLGVVLLIAGICRILAALVVRRVERHAGRPA
jgi:uncharacterized membrane protein HdeD (DUF308 family)